MDAVSIPLVVLLVAMAVAGVLTLGLVAFGLPGLRGAWVAHKGHRLRDRARVRVDRFAGEGPIDAVAHAVLPAGGGEAPRARPPIMGRRRPAARDRRDGAGSAWVESPRLRRLAAHVATQEELADGVGRQLDDASEVLRHLLDRQASALRAVMTNLGQQLGPVREFAAGEESNLRALQDRMQGAGMGFVAHAFAEVLEEQRERIEATRDQIERQREPFERFAADEQKSVELALTRLDEDIDALDDVLAEQRRITQRLVDDLRSDDFQAIMAFLLARQDALDEVAQTGITDPSEIAALLQAVRGGVPAAAAEDPQLREVLEHAASADALLTMSGTRAALPALAGPEPAEGPSEEPDDEVSTAA